MNSPSINVRLRRAAALLIAAAALAAVLWVIWHNSREGDRPAGTAAASSPAPAFEAVTLDGVKVRLADYRGQTVLINFWASWCKPCVREMPLLNELHASSGEGTEVLFVNVGEAKGTVSEFLEEQKFSFPVMIDVTGRISAAYGISALPATFVIDKEGGIQKTVLGEISDYAELKRWMENP